MKIDRVKRLQIAAAALCDERTVMGVYEGKKTVRALTWERIARAASTLQFALPPKRA